MNLNFLNIVALSNIKNITACSAEATTTGISYHDGIVTIIKELPPKYGWIEM